MSTLVDDLRALAHFDSRALYRVNTASGEHFSAGHRGVDARGLPEAPRVHLAVMPQEQNAMWTRGDAPNLVLHLIAWGARQNHRVRLEAVNEFDERGDHLVYEASLHAVEPVASARAADPLSALLRVLVQAHVG